MNDNNEDLRKDLGIKFTFYSVDNVKLYIFHIFFCASLYINYPKQKTVHFLFLYLYTIKSILFKRPFLK